MAAFGQMIITNRGLALQAKAQTGTALQFTVIKIGDGQLGGQSIPTLQGLINQKLSLPIGKHMAQTGKATLGAYLSNASMTTGFYFREIGIFATDPALGEILFAYANAGATAEYIPAGGGPDIVEKYIDLVAIIQNATNVSAVIDDSLAMAPLIRNIQTSGGLQGGGNLSADRTLSIAPKGVTAEKIADGAVTDTTVGNRTLSDNSPPTSDSGTLSTLFGWIGNMIKSITGKSSWRTAPATTLEAAKAHADDAVRHVTAAERTTWNAKASTATATGSANGLMSAADKSKLDGATNGASPNALMMRDANADVRARAFFSTAPTGTRPLVVESTTMVPNLNADMVDGLHVNVENADPLGKIPFVKNDGGIELGKYVDLHDHQAANQTDYDVRLMVGGNGTVGGGDLEFKLASAAFSGSVTGTRLISNIPNGTAPLQVTSATRVNGLNSDLLDDMHAQAVNSANTIVSRDINGDTQVRKLVLKAPEGQRPLIVESSTLNDNLNADMVDGIHGIDLVQKTVRLTANHDLNTVVESGFYRMLATVQNGPSGLTPGDGQLIVSRGGDTVTQMIFGWSSSKMAIRTGNPTQVGGKGIWQPWAMVLTSNAMGTGSGIDADKVDGYHVSLGNAADTIVARSPSGGIESTVFNSKAAEGTQPLTVLSSTKVVNLNVDMVDGYHVTPGSGSDPRNAIPRVAADGTIELGKYVDFHDHETEFVDYDVRFTTIGSGTMGGGMLMVYGDRVNALKFQSRIPTGTAPLIIASTTKVDNLNSDMTDGYHANMEVVASTLSVRDGSGSLKASSIYSIHSGGDYLRLGFLDNQAVLRIGGTQAPSGNGLEIQGVADKKLFRVADNGQVTNYTAQGTAPLVISSTTVVTNLNADSVDGYHMNQNVLTSSVPTFLGVIVTGAAAGLLLNSSGEQRVYRQQGDAFHGMFINDYNVGFYDWKNSRSVLAYNASTQSLTTGVTNIFTNLNADRVDDYHANEDNVGKTLAVRTSDGAIRISETRTFAGTAAGGVRHYSMYNSNVLNAAIGLGGTIADVCLWVYDDAGANGKAAVTVNRATGQAAFNASPTAPTLNAATSNSQLATSAFVHSQPWQKHPLTASDGKSILNTGTNLNNLTTPGFYNGSGYLNGPLGAAADGGWWYVEVFSHTNGTSYIMQRATHLTDNTAPVYVRICSGGTWGTWKKQLGQADYDKLFQFANDGKKAVANAITAKGVSASSSDTFATLADKVGQISSVAKFTPEAGAGSDVLASYPSLSYTDQDYGGKVLRTAYFKVAGLYRVTFNFTHAQPFGAYMYYEASVNNSVIDSADIDGAGLYGSTMHGSTMSFGYNVTANAGDFFTFTVYPEPGSAREFGSAYLSDFKVSVKLNAVGSEYVEIQ